LSFDLSDRAKHLEAAPVQIGIARRIFSSVTRLEMLDTVDFNNQPLIEASEVNDVPVDRNLSAEVIALAPPLAQLVP
jgi:hypothetical protein